MVNVDMNTIVLVTDYWPKFPQKFPSSQEDKASEKALRPALIIFTKTML